VSSAPSRSSSSSGRIVRVLPDEPAIDRVFDYFVPPELPGANLIRVGTEVRVALNGRRVGGWVVDVDVEPPAGVALSAIAKVRGFGPPAEVVELARWVAWRWAGRWANVLRFTTAPGAVRGLPPPRDVQWWSHARNLAVDGPETQAGREAIRRARAEGARGVAVVRLPPAADWRPLILGALAELAHTNADTNAGVDGAASGVDVLSGQSVAITVPTAFAATRLAARLRRDGLPVALLPTDWARAAAGSVIAIGARAAVFAPVPDLALGIVLDEHDETLRDERVPTWNARDVMAERCRAVGVPCVLVSAIPSLEALDLAGGVDAAVTVPRAVERRGWSAVRVIDRSIEDPGRRSLISPEAVAVLRSPGRIVCVLNRTGRVRRCSCVACGTVARCEHCGAALGQPAAPEGGQLPELVCAQCGERRPVVCLQCGGSKMKALRTGTAKVREELEVLAGRAVGEVTAETADAVIFLDLDADLLAPRFRSGEQGLALLVAASRIVGGRDGKVVVQTQVPRHEAIEAVLHADPSRFSVVEAERRRELRLPPTTAMALVTGAGAEEWASALRGLERPELQIALIDGKLLVRAPDATALADSLAAVRDSPHRPTAKARIEVDPLRI
jgi:primosomal protein N' (replication factor Y) (superfamily II helicase)